MTLNRKTKQNILDELKTRKINLSGKVDEVDFIKRFVDLSIYPSNDPRFENMSSDMWQHRVNNPMDWDDDWLLSDPRINLIENDDLFEKFICEFLHPTVRDSDEAQNLRVMINYYLKKDGYQVVEDEQFYEPGTYSYKFIQINPTQIEKSFKTSDEFVHEAYEKIDKRLREEDYSGAVTSARTLVEDAIKDIYYQITGDNLEKIDDLQDGYKKIQKLLKLDYDKKTDENKAKLLRSFVTIINSLSPIFNSMADRHATKSTAQRNSALLCTDSAKIFVNFLYGRMRDIHGLYPSLYDKLISILNSDLRLKITDVILKSIEIKKCLEYCDDYLSILLIDKLIEEYGVTSFRDGDIFFAFLRVLSKSITEIQLHSLLEKHKDNSQIAGVDTFLSELYKKRPEMFSARINKTISESKFIEFEVPTK